MFKPHTVAVETDAGIAYIRLVEEVHPPLSWDEAYEQGDERPVRPGEARSADLASEDRQLVAQDQDLGVLGEHVSVRHLSAPKPR